MVQEVSIGFYMIGNLLPSSPQNLRTFSLNIGEVKVSVEQDGVPRVLYLLALNVH